jgi:hypothetical protein
MTMPKGWNQNKKESANKDIHDGIDVHYLEEWKQSTELSMKFDSVLIDLRKYGFTIIAGLITASSFLGFSFDKNQFSSANIIQIGVIDISMILVVILFWLDIYYQSLLYGSVLRSRFLELFRLNYRLSTYLSGIYTGSGLGKSGMADILYLIYGGFLLGIFFLGFTVSSLPLVDANLASLKTDVLLSLIITFCLSIIALLVIGIKVIKKRNTKLEKISKKMEDAIFKKNSEKEIFEFKSPTEAEKRCLELEIYKKFGYKT